MDAKVLPPEGYATWLDAAIAYVNYGALRRSGTNVDTYRISRYVLAELAELREKAAAWDSMQNSAVAIAKDFAELREKVARSSD